MAAGANGRCRAYVQDAWRLLREDPDVYWRARRGELSRDEAVNTVTQLSTFRKPDAVRDDVAGA